jgi:hypothetical protein
VSYCSKSCHRVKNPFVVQLNSNNSVA